MKRFQVDDNDDGCDPFKHEWDDHYYGYECKKCGMFVAFGCEPWAPIDDDLSELDDDLLDGYDEQV